MRDRKQYRKVCILVKVVQTFGHLDKEQEEKVNETNRRLTSQYSNVNTEADEAAVEIRRDRLAASKDLQDVFEMFWFALNPYCTNGVLNRDGYIKCNKQVQIYE